jgi:phenylalanyl-tRNA synthetase alpha chain
MKIEEELNDIQEKAVSDKLDTQESIEAFRLKYLSRNGEISAIIEKFKSLPPEEKRILGKKLNETKKFVEDRHINALGSLAQRKSLHSEVDITRDLNEAFLGNNHPINQVKEEIISIFSRIGFDVSTGPEIEDDWHNFYR